MIRTLLVSLLLIVSCIQQSWAQKKNEAYTIEQLRAKFRGSNYTEDILIAFQHSMQNLRIPPQISEDIPGEVISWFTLNGRYSMQKTYLIKADKLIEITTLPKDDVFFKVLNRYVPTESRLINDSDLWSMALVTKKLGDDSYLIKATAKSFNSYPEIPNDDIRIYDLEYKTKDFKSFQLLRLKETNKTEWTVVK